MSLSTSDDNRSIHPHILYVSLRSVRSTHSIYTHLKRPHLDVVMSSDDDWSTVGKLTVLQSSPEDITTWSYGHAKFNVSSRVSTVCVQCGYIVSRLRSVFLHSLALRIQVCEGATEQNTCTGHCKPETPNSISSWWGVFGWMWRESRISRGGGRFRRSVGTLWGKGFGRGAGVRGPYKRLRKYWRWELMRFGRNSGGVFSPRFL